MTHVHYKFSSKRSYNTVVFDGVNITVCELKRLIMTKERLRASDCDLQIIDAQTKEEYTDEDSQISKGSSVVVRRVPSLGGKPSSSASNSGRTEAYNINSGFLKPPMSCQKPAGVLPIFSQMADLSTAEVSEDDKIKTIMNQSGYDSSSYQKYPNQYGAPLPANYTCYRCGSNEHHIRNCPVSMDKNVETPVRIKKSTGIPRSFMVKVDDPSIKGAMLTNTGDYAVPAIDAEAYAVAKKKIPIQEQQIEDPPDAPIPDELQCLICRDLLNDAVVIPCCGNSYCDDCIRSALLDSEDHVCPTCSQPDVSPDALIANKFLRQAVNNFTKEQISTQTFKSTPSNYRSQDCTPRPSPAPTPPPQSQPEKPQVTDVSPVIHSESPSSSSSTSRNVVKVLDETPAKETDVKKPSSPAGSPSVLVSNSDSCDSQPIPLVNTVTQAVSTVVQPVTTVTQAVVNDSNLGSTSPCNQAPHLERSASPIENWTALSAFPTASTSTTFSLPNSPNIAPPSIQTYLQQQSLSGYPPGFSPATPLWPSGPSPHGAPIPSFTSSPIPAIPPLLPKELMMYHRRNKERTPLRGSSYNTCLYNSKSCKSKSSRSSSRSPSRSRSHDRKRQYSPYSRHKGLSSQSHSSHPYSYKRSRSPSTTSSPSSHSHHRSRSPPDRNKNRHHERHHSSSSSRKRREREASEQTYNTYLRWKQEYTDWCEKYFNSYYSHFHQMPPPPLMPPPQPHWPSQSSYHHRERSPPSTDSHSSNSQSNSERSSTTTRSSSSRSDSTPTPSFSDSNSPQSDECSGAPCRTAKDAKQNKGKQSGKQKSENRSCRESPLKKTNKHKSKSDDKKDKDRKLSDKDSDRKGRREEKGENRHKERGSKETARTNADGSRQAGRSKSPDSRSDKSKKRRDEETLSNQKQNIPIESSSSSDLFPKALEREKTKKVVWKPQPLTKENAWEGGVKVKPQKKINININLEVKRNDDDKQNTGESYKELEDVSHTTGNLFYNQTNVNRPDEPSTLDEGMNVSKNDSWEIFPDDEPGGGEDSDLWQCALTAVELEESENEGQQKSAGTMEEDVKEQEDIFSSKTNHKMLYMTVDNSCSGEEQQRSESMVLEESMKKRSLDIKISRSIEDRDKCEKEQHIKASSHHREVKGKSKRRSVEVENTHYLDYSARLGDTVAPSSGRDLTDASFDFDRRKKKRADRESESTKGEESSRHKEGESCRIFSRKSSNDSSQTFTSNLDVKKYNSPRESDENRSREVKSHKTSMELDIEQKDKCIYSKSYYHSGHQDTKVRSGVTLHSKSDSRDRGEQVPSKTSTTGRHSGQNWTCPAPPTAESSRGTASDPEKTRERGEVSRSEHKKDKKQKSHKNEKRHGSPDELRKPKKRNKDGGQMDFSIEHLSDKHT